MQFGFGVCVLQMIELKSVRMVSASSLGIPVKTVSILATLAYSYHFTPLDSLNDNTTDTDDDSDLVADVDPDTFIRIVCHKLINGKAPGIDNVYNDILKKAIGTGFYKLWARAFTIS